jgi:hypothetical protein
MNKKKVKKKKKSKKNKRYLLNINVLQGLCFFSQEKLQQTRVNIYNSDKWIG